VFLKECVEKRKRRYQIIGSAKIQRLTPKGNPKASEYTIKKTPPLLGVFKL
jgi:hypothetical protein